MNQPLNVRKFLIMENLYKHIIHIIFLASFLGIARNYLLDKPLSLIKEKRIIETIEMEASESGEFVFELQGLYLN